jgi:hypothetical protein
METTHGKFNSCSLEGVCRTFLWWLYQREIMNPTFNTCATWLGYNFTDFTDQDINLVWDNYLNYDHPYKRIQGNLTN